MIHDNPNVQVITEDPTPDKVAEKLSGGVEDTLLLINMMKDLRMRELKKAKVGIIIITPLDLSIIGAKNLWNGDGDEEKEGAGYEAEAKELLGLTPLTFLENNNQEASETDLFMCCDMTCDDTNNVLLSLGDDEWRLKMW